LLLGTVLANSGSSDLVPGLISLAFAFAIPPVAPYALVAESPILSLFVALALIACSFALSVLLCNLARQIAPRFDFVDRPGGHKGHRVPTPLGGGVAIWLTTILMLAAGALISLTLGSRLPQPLDHLAAGALLRLNELVEILGLASIIMLMGLMDDRKSLNWKLRLGIQLGCAIVLASTGIRVTLFGPFTHPLLGGTVTVLWIVGLTNSFNMLDNMDGLAASVGLIVALLFSGAQIAVGSLFVPAVLLVLAGALVGFLVFNRPPARLFMGDAGSNFLGFLLGALTVVGTFTTAKVSPYGVLAPLLVMAVPLYDMSSVILIRLREGRSPFLGDRRHFSHRLVARGLTPTHAVLTIDLVTLASGLGALLLHRLDRAAAFVVIAQTLSVLGVVAILERSSTPMEPSQ
jgi:UDP-GlcNAc:undecaprenyl-phosphate GlcNAc-1-phosphate transferase